MAADPNPCISARDFFPERRGDWMQTYSGRRFWPLDPRPEDVAIEDIAHALSLLCRYGGHCLRFYAVAEHSVHLARWCLAHAAGTKRERRILALWLLLHDGSEGYISDMVRPLKRHMPEYRKAEDGVAWAVYEAFGLDPAMEPAEVKALDNRILMDERAQVMRPTGDQWHFGGATEPLGVTLQFWSPEQAEREFLATFADLTGRSVTIPALASPRADSDERTAGEVACEAWRQEKPRHFLNDQARQKWARIADAVGAAFAARVCHKEQLTIWSGEIVSRLNMGGYFRDGLTYDDVLDINAAVSEEIRSIVGSAFDLATPAQPAGAVPDSLRRSLAALDEAPESSELYRHCQNESYKFVRTLLASHPAGQSAGSPLCSYVECPALGKSSCEDCRDTPRRDGQSAGSGAEHQRDMALEALHTLGVRLGVLDPSVACDGPQLLTAMDAYSESLAAPASTRTGQGEATVAVPTEPTEAMVFAGYDATRKPDGTPQLADAGFCLGHAADIYAAMIAARPAAPEAQGTERLQHLIDLDDLACAKATKAAASLSSDRDTYADGYQNGIIQMAGWVRSAIRQAVPSFDAEVATFPAPPASSGQRGR